LRIIGGTGKSIKLYCPAGSRVRPTSDRVKESLFNILGSTIKDAVMVDGFAGTGSVGIEALSREAAFTYFIEKHSQSITAIYRNLNKLEVYNRAQVIKKDILKGLTWLVKQGVKADMVFLDPPYGSRLLLPSCNLVLNEGIVKYNGILVLEHHDKDYIHRAGVPIFDQRVYGDTVLTFLKRTEP